MPMPTFLVLGVAKAGTTSLYHYLRQHPQIYLNPLKESHFFAYGEAPLPDFRGPGGEIVQGRVVSGLDEYQSLFADMTDELACGDFSTTNIMPRACERIQRYTPDAKLIAILRQPAERAYSQFLHMRRLGFEPLSDFAQALAEETSRDQQNWNPFFNYTSAGFYYSNLRRYFALFRPAQIRIYLHEDWQTQPVAILQDLFRFIGVDERFVPDLRKRHNTGATARSLRLARFLVQPHAVKRFLKPLLPRALRQQATESITTYNLAKAPPLDPRLRAQLTERYRDDIRTVQQLIGRDISHWL